MMDLNDRKFLKQYLDTIGHQINSWVETFYFDSSSFNLQYQTQASAVFSSNIEGNSIDLNSYMNHQMKLSLGKPSKEIKEIEQLITAYQFAQQESLTEKNFLAAHKILAKTILIASLRGKYRNDKIGVFGSAGLVYLAVEESFVPSLMKDFFGDIEQLLQEQISIEEVFYFASLIHLRFVHIHPFRDGNGRAARLLEKWFLAQKLGIDYWKIPSERYYKQNQQQYYQHLNLGINFYELNYDKCLPFLAMLPNSLLLK